MREPGTPLTLILLMLLCFCVYGFNNPDGAEKFLAQAWAGLSK